MRRGILLISGLDSILAGIMIKEQKVPLLVLYFHSPFCTCRDKEKGCRIKTQLEKIVSEFLETSLQTVELGRDYLDRIKNPKYGYGKNMNPCIDCKIFMFKKAREYIKNGEASFLITGEVLGERPMSQNRQTLELIEKESSLERSVLRPLSAKLMPVTIPEEKNWVEREKLLNIQGRSRKVQLELADSYNLKNYPQPAGGCLLTDPGFSERLKDLMMFNPDFSIRDIYLLKVGRHFRIGEKLRLIVGRNEAENKYIEKLFNPDADALLRPVNTQGPSGLALGDDIEREQYLLTQILASYCKLNAVPVVEIEVKFRKREAIYKIKPQKRAVFSKFKVDNRR